MSAHDRALRAAARRATARSACSSVHDKEGDDPRFTDDDLRLAETLRAARRGRGRALAARRARRAAPRRRRPGARAAAARARAPRRDRPGADVDPARAAGGRGGDRPTRTRARGLAALRELVVATLQDVRRLAVELRPKALDDFGLVARARAARRQTFAEQTRHRRRRRGAARRRRGCRPRSRRPLYRIVQEALTNVVKHAQAQRVSVVLDTQGWQSVTAVIEDDGRGFDPASTRERRPRPARHARAGRAARRAAAASSRPGAGTTRRRRGAGRVIETIRVLIVDDHAVVRSGPAPAARRARRTSRSSARPATCATRSSRRAREKPDVILSTSSCRARAASRRRRAVLKEAPDAKVLVLSMQDDPRYVREAFAAGASGYVLKEAADTEVVQAVREVAGGGRYVHPALGARLVAGRGGGAAPRRGGSALRPRARGAAPARARPHEPGDREDALHLGAHGRDAPGAHHAEAPPRRPAPSSSATRSRTACWTSRERRAATAAPARTSGASAARSQGEPASPRRVSATSCPGDCRP